MTTGRGIRVSGPDWTWKAARLLMTELEERGLAAYKARPEIGFPARCCWVAYSGSASSDGRDAVLVDFNATSGPDRFSDRELGDDAYSARGEKDLDYEVITSTKSAAVALVAPRVAALGRKDLTVSAIVEKTRLWLMSKSDDQRLRPFLPVESTILELSPKTRLLHDAPKSQ